MQKPEKNVTWELPESSAQIVLNCVDKACVGVAAAQAIVPIALELQKQASASLADPEYLEPPIPENVTALLEK